MGDYRELALVFDPATLAVRRDNLEAYALADAVLGHDFYRPIIDTLRAFRRLRPRRAGHAGARASGVTTFFRTIGGRTTSSMRASSMR